MNETNNKALTAEEILELSTWAKWGSTLYNLAERSESAKGFIAMIKPQLLESINEFANQQTKVKTVALKEENAWVSESLEVEKARNKELKEENERLKEELDLSEKRVRNESLCADSWKGLSNNWEGQTKELAQQLSTMVEAFVEIQTEARKQHVNIWFWRVATEALESYRQSQNDKGKGAE